MGQGSEMTSSSGAESTFRWLQEDRVAWSARLLGIGWLIGSDPLFQLGDESRAIDRVRVSDERAVRGGSSGRGVAVRPRSYARTVRGHPHHAVDRMNYSPLLTPDESGRRGRPRLGVSVGPTSLP
jgi:hypothetical protein